MIGLIFALPRELESLRVKLRSSSGLKADGFTFYYGDVCGRSAVLVQSGIGRERSKRAAESLLKIFDVDAVISAGLAGGLRDGVRTGELIIAESVLKDYSRDKGPGGMSAGYPCHKGLVDFSCRLAREKGLEFHRGNLLTVNEVVAEPASKRRIGEATSAVAVDMEGVGVAEAAINYGTPFLALKVVSDEIDHELEGYDLVDEEGRPKVLSVVFYLIRNPLGLIRLIRLRNETDMTLDKLALFLRHLAEGYGEVLNPLHL